MAKAAAANAAQTPNRFAAPDKVLAMAAPFASNGASLAQAAGGRLALAQV